VGAKSNIEWTDSSWTPIRARDKIAPDRVGWHCEHVSEACRNCYAESMNRRLGTGLDYKPGNLDAVDIFLDEKMLLAPLRWRKPRKIFVCSTTDLFGDWVRDEWIDRVFVTMARAGQHTFQLLTKRPGRMREYISAFAPDGDGFITRGGTLAMYGDTPIDAPIFAANRWPLPNVWLGTTAEDEEHYRQRWAHMAAVPATVRFLSYEPALGPIGDLDLGRVGAPNWIIAGGESGPHARPSHPEWFRSLRDQCKAAGVPFFFKQWGEWLGTSDDNGSISYGSHKRHGWDIDGPKEEWAYRVGKSRAGRLLDGVEHSEFPPTSTGMEER